MKHEPVLGTSKPVRHDLDREARILASIFGCRACLDQVQDTLQTKHFYSCPNARIFGAMIALSDQAVPIDPVTVGAWLFDHSELEHLSGEVEGERSNDREEEGEARARRLSAGRAYLAQLAERTPTVPDIREDAQHIIDLWRQGHVVALAEHTAAAVYERSGDVQDLIEGLDRQLLDLRRTATRPNAEPLSHLLLALHKNIARQAEHAEFGRAIAGASTGYERLDARTGGLSPGDLVVVAGRPGMGKTAFMSGIGINIACPRRHVLEIPAVRAGDPVTYEEVEGGGDGVAMFSLEMPCEQIGMRIVCSEARVDFSKIRQGMHTLADWHELTKAASFLSTLPVWIDDTPALTVEKLDAKIRRLQANFDRPQQGRTPPRRVLYVMVDYLQLMSGRGKSGSREQELSGIARELKELAKERHVILVAGAQLNRLADATKGKATRPQMSHLRETGTIEEAADVVLLLYRDEYYHPDTTNHRGIAEVIIAKQKNGPTGTVLLRFDGPSTRFDNLVGYTPEDFDEAA